MGIDKEIRCPKCGNNAQFTEVVTGACYENRYYMDYTGDGEVVEVQQQKNFCPEEVTFICPSCEYDLSEDNFEADKNGDTDIRGQLMTKYREYLIAAREEDARRSWAYQALKDKITELGTELEGWQTKYRQAEEGKLDVLDRNAVLHLLNLHIARVADWIFMLNQILNAKDIDDAKE